MPNAFHSGVRLTPCIPGCQAGIALHIHAHTYITYLHSFVCSSAGRSHGRALSVQLVPCLRPTALMQTPSLRRGASFSATLPWAPQRPPAQAPAQLRSRRQVGEPRCTQEWVLDVYTGDVNKKQRWLPLWLPAQALRKKIPEKKCLFLMGYAESGLVDFPADLFGGGPCLRRPNHIPSKSG